LTATWLSRYEGPFSFDTLFFQRNNIDIALTPVASVKRSFPLKEINQQTYNKLAVFTRLLGWSLWIGRKCVISVLSIAQQFYFTGLNHSQRSDIEYNYRAI
jgi:hypothetical protein